MARTKKKDLKAIVEKGIMDVLESESEPSDGRIKALALGIKMCALNAKMEESEYGDFFQNGDAEADGISEKVGSEKPRKAKREGAAAQIDVPGED